MQFPAAASSLFFLSVNRSNRSTSTVIHCFYKLSMLVRFLFCLEKKNQIKHLFSFSLCFANIASFLVECGPKLHPSRYLVMLIDLRIDRHWALVQYITSRNEIALLLLKSQLRLCFACHVSTIHVAPTKNAAFAIVFQSWLICYPDLFGTSILDALFLLLRFLYSL